MQTFRKLPTTVPIANTIGDPRIRWRAADHGRGRSVGRSSRPDQRSRIASATSLGGSAGGVDDGVGHLPIQGVRGFEDLGDLAEGAGGRQGGGGRPAASARSRPASDLGVGRQPDHEAEPAQGPRFASRRTTPPPVASDRPGPARVRSRRIRSSQVAEGGLALLGEDRGDRPAGARLQLDVGIRERQAQSFGQNPADGRLAGPAVADQGSQTLRRSGARSVQASSADGPASLPLHDVSRIRSTGGVLAGVSSWNCRAAWRTNMSTPVTVMQLALAGQLQEHGVLGVVDRVEDDHARPGRPPGGRACRRPRDACRRACS